MHSVVDYKYAEQGATIRFSFVVLASGVPVVPGSMVLEVQDAPTSSQVALLSAQAQGDPGKYVCTWTIPGTQALGFYRLVVTPDVGAVDPLTFEVKARGAFVESQGFSAANTVSEVKKISDSRSEEVFVHVVRIILRDHPELNRLTAGRETSDGEIALAMFMALSVFNSVPPVFSTEYTFRTFPSIGWLTIGTVGFILNSAAINRHRNFLNYADGGVTVETENPQGYMALASRWWDMYLQWAPEYKVSVNINAAFGMSPTGVHSEYFLLSTLLGSPTYTTSGTLMMR
jgi:hypothetical protein